MSEESLLRPDYQSCASLLWDSVPSRVPEGVSKPLCDIHRLRDLAARNSQLAASTCDLAPRLPKSLAVLS